MTPIGPTLLITRPERGAGRFAEMVAAQVGVPVPTVLSPVLEIRQRDAALPSGPYAGAIVTSENGAAALRRLGLSRIVPVWAVGDRTAEAARAEGFAAVSAKGSADDLIRLILDARPEGALIHLRGEHARGAVTQRLRDAGLNCHDVVAYGQEPVPLTADALALLAGRGVVVLPLFSPRTVSVLAKQGPFSAPLLVVAISDAVTAEAAQLGPVETIVAAEPNALAMAEATARHLRPTAALEGGGEAG